MTCTELRCWKFIVYLLSCTYEVEACLKNHVLGNSVQNYCSFMKMQIFKYNGQVVKILTLTSFPVYLFISYMYVSNKQNAVLLITVNDTGIVESNVAIGLPCSDVASQLRCVILMTCKCRDYYLHYYSQIMNP